MSTISYTPDEVADILQISRFTVYELIKRGELQAYRIGRKLRIEPDALEAYKVQARDLHPAEIPPSPEVNQLIICGQDIVLDILTRYLAKSDSTTSFLRSYIGSISGLLALYHGKVNISTAHLWDGDTGDYNTPYVRRFLPGHRVSLFNLVYRQEGFYVAKNNPLQIKTWIDLTRKDIRFVNRELGSGARVLLDEQLRKLDLDGNAISGYAQEETSHVAVASCVARGDADVGLGSEQGALQVPKIDFIPLIKERYDLVIKKSDLAKPALQNLLKVLQSPAFQKEVSGLGGYDISKMGKLMAEL